MKIICLLERSLESFIRLNTLPSDVYKEWRTQLSTMIPRTTSVHLYSIRLVADMRQNVSNANINRR
jgi:hypothetical protein